jgi:hypothetical protein
VARFTKEGVLTFGDLATREPRDLGRVAGRAGCVFARLAAGEDDRAVPGGVPVQRIATCASVGDARDAAVATVIERAARTGRRVREAHVRFCAADGSHADRVERLAAGSQSSLVEVARTLTSVVSRDHVGGPALVTLTLSAAVDSDEALRASLPRRRTA